MNDAARRVNTLLSGVEGTLSRARSEHAVATLGDNDSIEPYRVLATRLVEVESLLGAVRNAVDHHVLVKEREA